jgi:hypothetical protein
MMKKYILNLLLGITCIYMAGCKKDNFLQDGSTSADGSITSAQVWANPDFARNFLNNIYSLQQNRFNAIDNNGAMLASGSDEAVNSNQNSSISTFTNGTWSPVKTIDDVYSTMYSGIRKTNIFLANIGGSAIIPGSELTSNLPVDATYPAQIARLKSQAYFLRAYFEFQLVERYGSMVIVNKVLDQNDNLDVPRNSFSQCVTQILTDCDSAIAHLPLNAAAWNTSNRGRATQAAAMAIKSRLLLYAASPQYNPSNDVTKWAAAAAAAKAIIDANAASIFVAYQNIFLWNVANSAYNAEVIYATATTNNQDVEINNAPVSFNGANGRTDPTQNMVDAFEMKTTGRLISDPLSGYNPANPYLNRDPRLGYSVMYNGSIFQNKPVDTFIGGKDGLGISVDATKTGYYLRKFVADAAVWNSSSNTPVRKPWIIFRYAEILLNYAEAVNESQGVAGITETLKYLNLVRTRGSGTAPVVATAVNMPPLQTINPTGNGYVAPNQDELRKRIHNERRVELCFEEHRFFDVRRWKEGETTFNGPVTGMSVTRTAVTPATYTYTLFTVENRVFTAKNYLYPISQNELNKAPSLGQNPGY